MEMVPNLLIFPSVIALLLSLMSGFSSGYISGNSIDSSVQESAFKTITRPRHRTGSLYRAILPPTLAGMEVMVVRLRSKTLWRKGANFSSVSIPPRTVPVPHVKRLVIVYQDMGNWSSQFYAIPGYDFVSPVVEFTAYDATNISTQKTRRIDLDPMGNPISIRFHSSAHSGNKVSGQKCASFHANGNISFSEVGVPTTCYTVAQGRFSIVIPTKKRNQGWAVPLGIGLGIGFMGMILVCYVGLVLYRLSKTKKVQVMERETDEGELFGTVWVGGSKMPSAAVTRTQPDLDNGVFA